MTLILASTSPRRRQLLTRLGIPFLVVPSMVDERPPHVGEDPVAYALDLAHQKAADVAERRKLDVILAADTVVSVDSVILGKPTDPFDAARMLDLLRGRSHRVVTAIVVQCCDQYARAVEAAVSMRAYSDDEIRSYVRSGEPMDKAGAYAIQGQGSALVERVVGCYETVIGLPLCCTQELLALHGLETVQPENLCHHFGS